MTKKNSKINESEKIIDLEKKSKEDSKKINNFEKKKDIEDKRIRLLELKNKETLKKLEILQKDFRKKSIKKGNDFLNEFKKQTITLSVAAFGFLAALTWRDVINASLAPILKGREGLVEYILVALFVTGLAIIIPILLTKLLPINNETKK